MKIVFRNLERSELARELVQEKLNSLFERFPDLRPNQVSVTLGMENSPQQAGPDLFSVKLSILDGHYQGVLLEKKAPNLYQALAEVNDHLLERLNRAAGKARSKNRKLERKFAIQN